MDDRPVKVLLVDDDEGAYVLTRSWLTESVWKKFVVEWVATYEGALVAIARSEHDLYLVDYRLGVRSGLELLRTAVERGCTAPVILLTAMGNREVDMEAMQAGAADYLSKVQLNADMLERSIRYALERQRAQEALRQAYDELERRVQERTAELVHTNEALRAEIAERQRAEEKLHLSQRLAAMGTAAARLAHEIANPLNGISTTVQILERYLCKQQLHVDETLTATVHDLKNEIGRLQSLLHEWRALARPQQLDLQPLSLATLAAEVLRVQAPHYEARAIYVEQAVPAELPLAMADREKVAQVLLNLCKNAVEAMPQGGVLSLRGFNVGNQVSITISDTGIGIPDGLDIFEPFTTTKASGTGLGLAIVQQIVAAHGGTLGYTSTPGQGTTFTLTLPTAVVEDRSDAH